MKFNKTLVLAVLTVLVVTSSNESLAQYYGSGTATGGLVVDKKLKTVSSSTYVDNIDYKQTVFSQNEMLDFRIVVENTGSSILRNIKLSDKLPNYLSLVYFPGVFDKTTNSINWTLDTLGVAETKTYLVRAKIDGTPSGMAGTSLKQTNKVCVEGQTAECDSASYFIAKVAIPSTGANDLVVKSTLGMVMAGLAMLARKKARGY